MTAEEFAGSILSNFTPTASNGFAALAAQPGIDTRGGTLRDVTELTVNPGEANEFFMGSEPIWADVQSSRAIERDVDATLLSAAKGQLALTGARGILLLSGTAGSGKSTSLKRLALSLVIMFACSPQIRATLSCMSRSDAAARPIERALLKGSTTFAGKPSGAEGTWRLDTSKFS